MGVEKIFQNILSEVRAEAPSINEKGDWSRGFWACIYAIEKKLEERSKPIRVRMADLEAVLSPEEIEILKNASYRLISDEKGVR